MPGDTESDERVDSPKKPNGGRAPRSTREEIENRIETIRQLIVDGHNLGDIKRSKSREWGVAGRTIWSYILLARKRNKQALRISGDEACATSIAFWAARQHSASADANNIRRQIEEAEKDEAEWAEKLQFADADQIEAYTMELTRLTRRVDSLAKRLAGALNREAKAHDRIDTILGTKAPTKVAITDAHGNDLPRDPTVIEHRLVAMGFALPALPDGTGGGLSQLPTLPNATRLEASARRLDSRE